jgi:hypothetical protein
MTLTTDFRTVTDRIQTARNMLAKAEVDRLSRRAAAANAEANLDHTRTYLMALPAAGTNDTARRAYAAYHTQAMQDEVRTLATDVVYAERDVIGAATELRIAEDERRYLEFVAKIAVTGEPYNAFAHVNSAANGNGHGEEEFAL